MCIPARLASGASSCCAAPLMCAPMDARRNRRIDVKTLHAKIGEMTIEKDFLALQEFVWAGDLRAG